MAKQITDANFEAEVLQARLPVMVDFWAPWCGPCRAVGPIIDDLATQYEGKVIVGKMNVDDNQVTAGKYNIQAIPTLILFKDGEVLGQLTGAVSRQTIANLLEQKVMS